MAKVIGVMGESGSGKTTAMRNLPPEATFYLDCDKKGLNWKGWKKQYNSEGNPPNYWVSDSFTIVSNTLKKINTQENFRHIKYVVIDTLNGLMVAEEMRILAMQSGDKRSAWSDLAQNGWSIVNQCLEMRADLTIIILCHSETISDDNGIIRTRIKTNGRKLEKLVLESKMTTVVWSVRQDGKYKFILSADGSTCKVPMNSFDTDEIDNDIMLVVKALEDY
ncbi:MAG: AAA family ATPase [Christensenellales bacterium]|nr:AAA family ATPase [Christensenellales bacterium]